ncbi:MAG TPA: NAD(P)H-quinone oxidoreductase [Thermoanaerobaculia bacterium]|jgi:putative PIG3 family NAD(P)H quinone oxidoreductase|nr:NAD(P)H-quinone oxidoreductase [Thermoanaerobaculia bacterium]
MRAIVFDQPGDESVLHLGDVAPPPLGADELRIRAHAAGVNRADLLQRQGHYPPPPGASPILGLECAGEVIEIGSNVAGWSFRDRAMALLAGGGYAEEAVVHYGSAMHVPDLLSDDEAGAFPEVFLTAWLNVFELARARAGETLLVHGGGSGVGTAATTLAKLAGLRVIVTAGSREKCERCLAHGADEAINYNEEDFVERARGANVILDHIGARYLARDLECLAVGGRVVVIGSMGGPGSIELNVGSLLGKRQQIIGSTLRARPNEEKAAIIASFVARFGDDLRAGRIRPVIDRVFPIAEAAAAHRAMKEDHFGKIVLKST